jgi:hypothetical protein
MVPLRQFKGGETIWWLLRKLPCGLWYLTSLNFLVLHLVSSETLRSCSKANWLQGAQLHSVCHRDHAVS